jgi:hypothetical protein
LLAKPIASREQHASVALARSLRVAAAPVDGIFARLIASKAL